MQSTASETESPAALRSGRERVLVVVPAHNEERTITPVLERIRASAPGVDLVVVNDGSTDRTADMIRAAGEKQLVHPCNLGYGLAIQTGLKFALRERYDVVVTLDADGQHDPADVPRVVKALDTESADLVIASRFCGGRGYGSAFGRRLGQMLFSYLCRVIIGRRIFDTTSGFKAMNMDACRAVVDATFMDFHTETIVRLSLLGFRVSEIETEVEERTHGRSMHTFFNAAKYPIKTVLLTIVAAVDALLARRTK